MTTHATGKTPAGKAISARNVTTHGLFCRQTVLPHLGEDPNAFGTLLDALGEQLRPRNLMERQYLELWADASWKLRRLSRFEAQVWEDDRLDEDARLTKLERVARLQTTLRRQLDKAVRLLSHDVPNLFAHRTREDVLEKLKLTEKQCADNPYRAQEVEQAVQANRHWPATAEEFDALRLDTTPPPADPDDAPAEPQNCQNELPDAITGEAAPGADIPDEPQQNSEAEKSQNERALSLPHDLLPPPLSGAGGLPAPLSVGEGPGVRSLQQLEDLLNSGTLTREERRSILLDESLPGLTIGSGGHITIHKK